MLGIFAFGVGAVAPLVACSSFGDEAADSPLTEADGSVALGDASVDGSVGLDGGADAPVDTCEPDECESKECKNGFCTPFAFSNLFPTGVVQIDARGDDLVLGVSATFGGGVYAMTAPAFGVKADPANLAPGNVTDVVVGADRYAWISSTGAIAKTQVWTQLRTGGTPVNTEVVAGGVTTYSDYLLVVGSGTVSRLTCTPDGTCKDAQPIGTNGKAVGSDGTNGCFLGLADQVEGLHCIATQGAVLSLPYANANGFAVLGLSAVLVGPGGVAIATADSSGVKDPKTVSDIPAKGPVALDEKEVFFVSTDDKLYRLNKQTTTATAMVEGMGSIRSVALGPRWVYFTTDPMSSSSSPGIWRLPR